MILIAVRFKPKGVMCRAVMTMVRRCEIVCLYLEHQFILNIKFIHLLMCFSASFQVT